MLDQMMEKLYVLSENSQYHLKVENDAIPMSVLNEHRKAALNNVVQPAPSFGGRKTSSEMGNAHISQMDLKLREIEANTDIYLSPDKCIIVRSYAQINDRIFEYKVYFLLKPEKEVHQIQVSPSKKK